MSLLSFLEQLAAADAHPHPTARRGAVAQLARTAAAALPTALASLTATTATAQSVGTGLDGLLLALRIERLQDAFYGRILGDITGTPPVAPGLVPAAIRPDLVLIRSQQRQHIALLENYIRTSGGLIPAQPNYDFSGRRGDSTQPGVFADVLSNTDTMLTVAQVLEDLSVRTYISLTPLLGSADDLLDAVVRMFAVEGRHAAHIRQLRRERGATVKHWISGTESAPLPTAAANVYAGEDRVLQQVASFADRDTSTLLPTTGGITAAEITAAATEAFDEPLSNAALNLIIGVFTY